jgi:hypothetical protein
VTDYIPREIKQPAEQKAEWLRKAGYEIDDTYLPGPVDLAKLIRWSLVQFATETAEQTVARLGLVQKTGDRT